MSRCRFAAGLVVAGSLLLLVGPSSSQVQIQPGGPARAKPAPKPEPVAETKLLMEGLAGTNMRGLGRLLRDKPADAEAWNFARGQALLIAETGNLLLLRPPTAEASRDAWMTHAGDVRDAAVELARAAGAKDYQKARSGLAAVANACNHCHQAFRVQARVDPFGQD